MRLLVIILFLPVFGHCQIIRANPFYISNGTDADAQKFIDSAGITDPTQQSAIITLVRQLKDSSLWTSFYAIYPMVGGSATSCKWNLKDVRDLDAAFRLTFFNSPTFSSNGVDWNGTTQYAETYLTPSTTLSLNNSAISYYCRDNDAAAFNISMGTSTTDYYYIVLRNTGDTYFAINSGINTSGVTISNSDSRGYFVSSRKNSTQVILSKNGTSSTIAQSSSGLSTLSFYLGARHGAGAVNFTTNQCAFATIGLGLTTAQIATLYNIIQAFQTTLARNV